MSAAATTTDLSRLKFDAASHTYTLDGDKPFVSVSYVIKQCFPEFNADATIVKMRANKDRFERGPYANMSNEEIKAQWEKDGEIARDEGTLMHANIEASLQMQEPEPATLEQLPKEYLEYAESEKLREAVQEGRVRCEWRIFHESWGIAGTIDCLIHEKDDPSKVTIIDWKRSKRAHEFNGYGRKSLVPGMDLQDAPYWKYALQLNFYRAILEEQLQLKVVGMKLVQIHPSITTGKCRVLPVERLEKETQLAVEHVRFIIESNKQKKRKREEEEQQQQQSSEEEESSIEEPPAKYTK